ncbi:type II toxin-antitoxin system HicB family antitoxin [Candidatus Poriferisodalis sp.]|uniref:type II toxin-antitoxin system HicB family antitoxin n=1 Tax=Candidatus Poriferisodalis sp. TaxID=3101277 RepID=UPI003B02EBBA
METTVTPQNIEVIFEVSEDDVDGGYAASALGYGIHTQAETIEEVRENAREAVECYFDDPSTRPSVREVDLPLPNRIDLRGPAELS